MHVVVQPSQAKTKTGAFYLPLLNYCLLHSREFMNLYALSCVWFSCTVDWCMP